jgi:hypothetical protein
MKSHQTAGAIWAEILVGLAIVFVGLCSLAIYVPTCDRTKLQSLSNLKQLQIAAQQMAEDYAANGQSAWPGDTGGTFAHWASNLVQGGYLTTNDFCKLVSGPGRICPPHEMPGFTTSAVLVYAVRANSPTNTLFLSTANFTNTPSGGLKPLAQAKPYGKTIFTVMRKDGTGDMLQGRQAGNPRLIGEFAPLCR